MAQIYYYYPARKEMSRVPSNMPVQLSSGARPPNLCLKLHLVPYIVWVNSEGSGETAWMCRLAWAFAIYVCYKYPFHMSWLKIFILITVIYYTLSRPAAKTLLSHNGRMACYVTCTCRCLYSGINLNVHLQKHNCSGVWGRFCNSRSHFLILLERSHVWLWKIRY